MNMEGDNVTITHGYPAPTAGGIGNTLATGTVVADTPGRYTAFVVNANDHPVPMNGATNPAQCWVQYMWAGAGNAAPTVTTAPRAAAECRLLIDSEEGARGRRLFLSEAGTYSFSFSRAARLHARRARRRARHYRHSRGGRGTAILRQRRVHRARLCRRDRSFAALRPTHRHRFGLQRALHCQRCRLQRRATHREMRYRRRVGRRRAVARSQTPRERDARWALQSAQRSSNSVRPAVSLNPAGPVNVGAFAVSVDPATGTVSVQ